MTAGSSYYHGLQTKIEKRFADGLNFLATYTYSKTRTDAGDLLNGGSKAGYRAPGIPGLGIHYDYGLADFDIRNVFHLSGGYELPFGKGKRYLANGGIAGKVFGWLDRQHQRCSPRWTADYAHLSHEHRVDHSWHELLRHSGDGAIPEAGIAHRRQWKTEFLWQPGGVLPADSCTALPCPLSALGGPPDQIAGPPFKRMDFSVFKEIQLTERFRLEFRSEFFNILNHPNFNAPNFGGNGVVAVSGSGNFTNPSFGEIGSTRDAPYDPRQIQFALKLYF